MEDLGTFLGRFHPIWVHLPIGILILLGGLELAGLLARSRSFPSLPVIALRQRTFILAIAAAAAGLAALLGWMLAAGGDYDAALIDRHRTLGLAAAGATLLLLAVHRLRWLYAPALALTLIVLVAAAHAGGKITHGSDYLTAYMPAGLRRLLGVAEPAPAAKPRAVDFEHAEAFAQVVQPILQERCTGCHGPAKSNAGLRLDTWEFLVKGGKHGPVLKPGDLAGSPLVRRVDLPTEVKEHMPPKGKPQLGDDDLTLLEWWVGAGAPRNKVLPALDLPPAVQDILEGRLGGGRVEAPPDRVATLAQAAQIAGQLGIIIRPLSPDGPWLDINARAAGKGFGDRELAQLAPVASAVQWLDLGNTAITDAGLAALQPMHKLERLHLDLSAVTDEGLARLSRLKKLVYLNLRGTAVTDKGLASLRTLPRLRSLYVWQTAVTPSAVQALGDSLIDRRKIARWKAEQDELEREVRSERFEANTGESLRAPVLPPPVATAGNAAPPAPPVAAAAGNAAPAKNPP